VTPKMRTRQAAARSNEQCRFFDESVVADVPLD
jgi:hypothetical protein